MNAGMAAFVVGRARERQALRSQEICGQIELTPEQAKIVKDAIEAGKEITIKINFDK